MPDLTDFRIRLADLLRAAADRLWPADDVPAYWRVKRDIEAAERAMAQGTLPRATGRHS